MLFGKIALRAFGNLTEEYLDYFDGLKINLRKSSMDASLHEYLSVAALYSMVTFAISMVAASLAAALSLASPAYSYTLAIIVSTGAASGVFALMYYYPSIVARSIKGDIEKELPFSVFYMATISSSGVNPIQIFKMLAKRKGAIGDESRKIYKNVAGLGMNLTNAIQKAATKTPSLLFADLLWGMVSVITIGGDLEAYLNEKTRSLMVQYRHSLDDYSNQISLYTEIYITLIIVGSLFFIILIAILAPLVGGNILFVQTFLVFFFMPLVSIGFILLLKSIAP